MEALGLSELFPPLPSSQPASHPCYQQQHWGGTEHDRVPVLCCASWQHFTLTSLSPNNT